MKAAHEFFEREKNRCEIKQKNTEMPNVEVLSVDNSNPSDMQMPHESQIQNSFVSSATEDVYDEHNGFYDFVSQINFQSKNMKSYPIFVMEAT